MSPPPAGSELRDFAQHAYDEFYAYIEILRELCVGPISAEGSARVTKAKESALGALAYLRLEAKSDRHSIISRSWNEVLNISPWCSHVESRITVGVGADELGRDMDDLDWAMWRWDGQG